MRRKISLLFTFLFLCCAGCASMSQTMSQAMDKYIASVELGKENAIKLAKISAFKTCFIRTYLGSDINNLSYKIVGTLDAIDKLMKEIGVDYDKMTDCQKGKVLALWSRLITLGILEIVESINPGVLGALL